MTWYKKITNSQLNTNYKSFIKASNLVKKALSNFISQQMLTTFILFLIFELIDHWKKFILNYFSKKNYHTYYKLKGV